MSAGTRQYRKITASAVYSLGLSIKSSARHTAVGTHKRACTSVHVSAKLARVLGQAGTTKTSTRRYILPRGLALLEQATCVSPSGRYVPLPSHAFTTANTDALGFPLFTCTLATTASHWTTDRQNGDLSNLDVLASLPALERSRPPPAQELYDLSCSRVQMMQGSGTRF